MRGLWSTIMLVVVLAGLGAYIYFVDSKRPAGGAAESKEKVFTVESDKIEEIRVTADQQTSVLRKENGTWRLTEPVQANADQNEVSSITSAISSLEVNRVVEENAADLAQYGLATPRIQIAFKGGGASGELHLGEKSPTQADVYAVRPGQKRVFLVQAFHESSLNKKPFDLRDKRVLLFERDKADRLEITRGKDVIELVRGTTDWEVKQPVQARADYGAIEGLLTRLSTATMTKLVEGASTIDKPAITVTIGAGSNRATMTVAEEVEGEVRARDMSRDMVFTIDPTLVTDLKKPVDDFRNKDIFQFRPFNLAVLRVSRGTDTYEFKKVPGTGDAADKWQRVAAGATADVDSTKMDDLLSKLNALRALSFVPKAAGDTAITVSASYDNGKFERARLGKTGAEAYGVRDGEPGAAKLDQTAYDEMVKALDAVVK